MEDSSKTQRPEVKTEVSLTQNHERKKQSEDSSNSRNSQTLTRASLGGSLLEDKPSKLLAWCLHGDNKTTVADFETMEHHVKFDGALLSSCAGKRDIKHDSLIV